MAACRMVSLGSAPTISVNVRNCCSGRSNRISTQMPPLLSAQFPPGSGMIFHSRVKAAAGRDSSLARGWAWSNQATPWNPSLSASIGGLNANCGGDSRLGMVALASSSGEVSVASTSGGEEQREELKEKLLIAIEAADGNLNEECVSIITELAKLNPNVGVLEGEEGRKLWVGAFAGVKANFKGSGKKGGGKAEVGYKGASATLGRLSFNCFKPADLDVYFSDFLNEVFEEPQGGYLLITTFTFDNPRGPDLPPVDGIIFSTASYNNVGPNKQEVVFQSSVTRPRFPEKDLEVWKEVFAENAGMDEQGQVSATLPDHKGALDYLYIDEELRITRGNYGAYVVVRKLPELAPEFKL